MQPKTPSHEGKKEGDFSRLQGIAGWPQELLMEAKVMVCGIGALGNEVAKCLALTGVGEIFLVDIDVVEPSNLTRSILFRSEDGKQTIPKVEAAKRTIEEINLNPNCKVHTFWGNLADLGRGVYRRMDLIFCATDSRTARLLLNGIAMELGKVWIDAGFQTLNPWAGTVTVYDGAREELACYACSFSEGEVLEAFERARGLSCVQFGKQLRQEGFLASTPTLASLVAALQVQEGFRILAAQHDLVEDDDEIAQLMFGKSIMIDTRARQMQKLIKTHRGERCYHHQTIRRIGRIETFPGCSSSMKVEALFEVLKSRLGTRQLEVMLPTPVVYRFHCALCKKETWLEPFLSAITFTYRIRQGLIACSFCEAKFQHIIPHGDLQKIDPTQRIFQLLKTKTLQQIGVRPLDVLRVLFYNPSMDILWAELTGDETHIFAEADAG